MPPTDPRYLAYTPEALWIEWFEDMLEKDPDKLKEAFVTKEEANGAVFTGNKAFDEAEALAVSGDYAALDRLTSSWDTGSSPVEEPPEEGFVDVYK